ncbi:MAG: hypothetical protein GX761_04200 [Gammaproteobacteria bacterium]|nr:hypothetical protein [Gammaproteobacteria bacterium]
MGIHDLHDQDPSHLVPSEPALVALGKRIVVGHKDESVRTIEINRKLAGAIARELMASQRASIRRTEIRQCVGGSEHGQATPQQVGPAFAMLAKQKARVIAFLLQLPVRETQIHP